MKQPALLTSSPSPCMLQLLPRLIGLPGARAGDYKCDGCPDGQALLGSRGWV